MNKDHYIVCLVRASELENKSNFFFQADDGIRDLVRSRELGDVYTIQVLPCAYQRPV